MSTEYTLPTIEQVIDLLNRQAAHYKGAGNRERKLAVTTILNRITAHKMNIRTITVKGD